MGKRSRDKGVAAERAAARIMRLLCPDSVRRSSGEESHDTVTGRDLVVSGYCVQVKEMGSPSPLVAYAEARSAAGENEVPIAIVRQSRLGRSTPFRVILSVADFLNLARAAALVPDDERAGIAFRTASQLEELSATDERGNMRARIG